MFFVIERVEQATYNADRLTNPKNPANPMVLGVYRNHSRSGVFKIYSKKAFGEFWDNAEQKKISRSHWTPEMRAFEKQKAAEAPKPPYIFRLTIGGWIFVSVVFAFFCLLTYNSIKPPIPKSAAFVAMEQAPVTGDTFFGHYEAFKTAGDRVASGVGFGWFKVVKVEGDVYYIARSMEMSKTSQPKEQLNSTDFEGEGTPMKITRQAGYSINLKATDGTMEMNFSGKK